MRAFMIFLLLALLVSSVSADEISFTFKDVNTRELVSDVIVYAVSRNSTTRFVEKNASLVLDFPPGSYEVSFLIDDSVTKGQDYFGSVQGNLPSQTVFVFPIGTMRGIVKDALDNVVGYASLKFDCRPVPGTSFPESADKFGSFYIEAMPAGSCKIYATYLNGIGTLDISVKRGELVDVELKLDKTIVARSEPLPTTWLVVFIIVLALVIWFAYNHFRPRKIVHAEKPVLKTGSRAQDVLKTLNAKEREVVNYVIPRKEVTQAEIRHNIGIPRTSLARVLQSLEAKNVIKIRKFGKAVKVQLTDWFLEKE